MTDVHSCSYYCDRPECIKAQRDELRERLAQPEQEQWDAIPDAFNEWWNADYDDTGNPFRKGSPAYWAWAGWQAASKQPEQIDWEGVAVDQAMTIALLKSELQEFADKEADAVEVALTESGWIWDGDQWQRPAQRKPLTDEEIDELSRTMVKGSKSANWLCRAIEASHGIKGDA